MNTMLHKHGKLAGAMLFSLAALGYSGLSQAGCVDVSKFLPSKGQVSFEADAPSAHFLKASYDDRDYREPAIVGLWKFEMLSKSTPTHKNPMPDGTLIDFGTAAWHIDGTELQASGFRNPADGDVCQGVWQQLDEHTFVLNHVALAWTSGSYTGPVNIRARVTVDPSRNRYAGQFSTVVYLASATPGHEFDQTTVLASITGTFDAVRVTQ
jgi:hypothetical protein